MPYDIHDFVDKTPLDFDAYVVYSLSLLRFDLRFRKIFHPRPNRRVGYKISYLLLMLGGLLRQRGDTFEFLLRQFFDHRSRNRRSQYTLSGRQYCRGSRNNSDDAHYSSSCDCHRHQRFIEVPFPCFHVFTVLLYKPLGGSLLSAVRIDILIRVVSSVAVPIEAATGVRIGGHRINAQVSAARLDFAVSAAVFLSSIKNLAWFSPGQLYVKSEFFHIRDSGPRARVGQAVSLLIYQ